ncbi:MAG: hypothetical protein IPH39_04095 [Sulfuritalea sp.]|nr:hypothetical protein [Sulfuritalea sp.]
MKLLRLVVLVFLTVAAQSTLAQGMSTARALVERGLNAYLADGATAAIQGWTKGSSLEGNTQTLAQANGLRQIEDYYGKPESFNILRENAIGPRSQMVVFSVNFNKGIMFGRFQAYQTKAGEWVATEFKFHTEAAMLLPAELVYDLKIK